MIYLKIYHKSFVVIITYKDECLITELIKSIFIIVLINSKFTILFNSIGYYNK